MLARYTLTTNYPIAGESTSAIALPPAAFSQVEQLGPLGVYRLNKPTHAIAGLSDLARPDQWRALDGRAEGMRMGFEPAVGQAVGGSLHVHMPAGGEFELQSVARFSVPVDGLFALSYRKSVGTGTFTTLYEAAARTGLTVRPLNMVDRGQGAGRWHGELYFAPIVAGRHYGLYLYGSNTHDFYYSDFRGYFIPYTSP